MSHLSTPRATNAVPLVTNLTTVGSVGLLQVGDSVLASTQTNNADHHVVTALPGNVTAAGPWVVTVTGTPSFTRGSTYPSFGVIITNGITPSTSLGLFTGYYQFNGNFLVNGVWTVNLNTQNRPNTYFFDNAYSQDSRPFYFRIVNDGTNYLYQGSQVGGQFWRTYYTNTVATVGITPTHYGFGLGTTNGGGFVSAVVDYLSMVPLAQKTITNVTFSGGLYTVTTSVNHGLITGDSVTINGVTGTGTSPNGVYENTVIATGNNTFTVPAGGSFTYTSGGLLTLTSR